MNKKKGILLVIMIIGVILIFSSFLMIKHNKELQKKEEEKRKERIGIIHSTYRNYLTGEKLECDNNICELLNNYLDVHEKINSFEVTPLELNEINDIDGSLAHYEEVKQDLYNWQYDDINKYLKEYKDYEKNAFLDIYNDSDITKSIEADLDKKAELLKSIENNIDILNFLVENDDNFISNNYSIVYLTDDFKNAFSSFNLDIPLVSMEQAYGKRIPILMYHGVDDNVWGNSSLFVVPSNFEQQMDYLSQNGYTTLFLSEIGSATNYEKPVIITFDDGYLDMYTIAYPIMKARGIKSNMYIITSWLDGEVYMTPQMVKELSDSGLVEIGSHTLNHVHLNSLSYEEQEKELVESKQYLENLIGKEVITIAYPYGQRNIDTLNIAKNYYRFAVTTEGGANYSKTYAGSSLLLKRYNMQRGTGFETFKSFVG